jgi:hypothetical protein
MGFGGKGFHDEYPKLSKTLYWRFCNVSQTHPCSFLPERGKARKYNVFKDLASIFILLPIWKEILARKVGQKKPEARSFGLNPHQKRRWRRQSSGLKTGARRTTIFNTQQDQYSWQHCAMQEKIHKKPPEYFTSLTISFKNKELFISSSRFIYHNAKSLYLTVVR